MATKKKLLAIFLLTLLPRLYLLGATAVYPDEITWMVKGKELVYALKNRDTEYLRHAWWNVTEGKETYAIGLPATALAGLFHVVLAGEGKYSLHLFSDIGAARLGVVILHSFLPVAIYWYGRKLGNERVGTVAAISYALSPIAFGLDRWVIHDSSLALFSFLAIASYRGALEDKKDSFWPGVWLGLAFLVKPNALFVPIVWVIASLARRKYRIFISSFLSFLMTVTILWPQSWFKPGWAIVEYVLRQMTYAGIGQSYFYFGHAVRSVPWTYYFFQLGARTPEIVLIFFGLAIFLFIYKRVYRTSWHIWPTTAYCSIFLLFMSLVTLKNGIRYILPLLPWLYLVAAWGVDQLRKRWITAVYLALCLLPFSYFPNTYSLYYNAFVGGGSGAQRYDLVGLCLGDKAALNYLDSQQITGTTAILGCSDTGLYHTGRPLTQNWGKAEWVILEYAHLQQFPESPEVSSLTARTLYKTIQENGVVTAFIYH